MARQLVETVATIVRYSEKVTIVGIFFRKSIDGTIRLFLASFLILELALSQLKPVLDDMFPSRRLLLNACHDSEWLFRFFCVEPRAPIEEVTISSTYATVALLLILPWELWRDSFTTAFAVISGKAKPLALKGILFGTVRFLSPLIAFLAFPIIGVCILELLKRLLSEQTLLESLLAFGLFYVFFLIVASIAEAVPRIRDRLALMSLRWPSNISRSWTLDVCENLRTDDARLRFIETIRLRGIAPTERFDPFIEEPWMTRAISESLTRLESSWAGLEE